ncbi:MAG: histidinol dehydrogenase [Hyphomicrobiales bacterium]
MVLRLNTKDDSFEADFQTLLGTKREVSEDVDTIVRDIIENVRANGDKALVELTLKFDNVDLSKSGIRVSPAEIEAAKTQVDADTYAALKLAANRIQSHHQRQKPRDDRYTDAIGVELGSRWTALESVGLYVPGGTASYPSSVLMNAIPARVAGVERLVMVVPTPHGTLNPLVLAAADLAGVDEIYRVGGAQAIAALAYGTNTIAPVSKIVGPGNAFVAAAKRRVFGTVGIDMIAGPSEVLVIADGNNNPDWIAVDLLAQAEHDIAAQSILITDDAEFGEAVIAAVEQQLKTLPREDIARESWETYGAIIEIDNVNNALDITNRIAPEHLELAIENADDFANSVRNAGAIFIGAYTPEAIGDYVGGSNHVLPTARSARFSSGLSVMDFVKRTSLLKCGPDQLRAIGPAAVDLAKAEGLDAHGKSVSIRLNF